ncbi:MAG: hypothetical protein O3A66_01960, partial [Proteobacteria bacterium]|nr:hypothetical protein [Pseudomonadota bacterium]
IAFENYRVSGFINDTTGSICEVALPNVNLIKEITQNSTVVYLQTTEAHRNILAERSKKAIKPILYNMDFLMKNLKSYYKKETFDKTFEINPEFFIELFPRLLEFRSRAYKEFVQKTNGKVIDVSLLHNTHSAREFLDVVNSN